MLEGRQLLSSTTVTDARAVVPSPTVLHAKHQVKAEATTNTTSPATLPVTYYQTIKVGATSITFWQGLRNAAAPGEYIISGTSKTKGILYIGPISGVGGKIIDFKVPGSVSTSAYGLDNLPGGKIEVVGSYRAHKNPQDVQGFIYEGTLAELKKGVGKYTTINNAPDNYVHSVSGGYAVGASGGVTESAGTPTTQANAFLFNIGVGEQAIAPGAQTPITFPGWTSETAYGIWYNGGTSYTIAGGYLTAQSSLGHAYLVDYDSSNGQFSNLTTFDAPAAANTPASSHFEGISGVTSGSYTLNADSFPTGGVGQGWFVTVPRNLNGTFGTATWEKLNYPGATGLTSSNSVAGNQVVGLVFAKKPFVFQATVNS